MLHKLDIVYPEQVIGKTIPIRLQKGQIGRWSQAIHVNAVNYNFQYENYIDKKPPLTHVKFIPDSGATLYNWEDDAEFIKKDFKFDKERFFGDINIFDFHPIHIFMNSTFGHPRNYDVAMVL